MIVLGKSQPVNARERCIGMRSARSGHEAAMTISRDDRRGGSRVEPFFKQIPSAVNKYRANSLVGAAIHAWPLSEQLACQPGTELASEPAEAIEKPGALDRSSPAVAPAGIGAILVGIVAWRAPRVARRLEDVCRHAEDHLYRVQWARAPG